MKEENTEYKQFIEAGLQEMDKERSVLKGLRDRLENIGVEKEKSDQKLTETERRIKKLEAQNKKLEDKLEQKDKVYEELRQRVTGIVSLGYLNLLIGKLVSDNISKKQKLDDKQFCAKDSNKLDKYYTKYDLSNDVLQFMKGLKGLIRYTSLDDGCCGSDKETDSTHPRSSFQTLVKTMRCSEPEGKTM